MILGLLQPTTEEKMKEYRRQQKRKRELWGRAKILERRFSYRWLEQQLFEAERRARRGKTHTTDVYIFELRLVDNIKQLAHDIWGYGYKPTPGIKFVVKRPVPREVYAAPFRDRVVHHFLFDLVYPWWDNMFINNSYSCRYGKGALYGMEMLRRQIRRVSENYTREAYILKLDVQGFFMSLNHKKLMERVEWGLDIQFDGAPKLKRLLKYLWRMVIFTDPKEGVRLRGKKSDWDILPPTKILANQPPGTGIVIGNLTSQLLSNIYMDLLDRYIMYKLKYTNYGRYVDDFYIVVPAIQKKKLLKDVAKIRDFLKNEMLLTLHPKKLYLQEVKHGVEFLGFVVKPYYTMITKRFKNNFTRAAIEVEWGIRSLDAVASYLGRLKHVDGKKFAANLFEWVGWEYRF